MIGKIDLEEAYMFLVNHKLDIDDDVLRRMKEITINLGEYIKEIQ